MLFILLLLNQVLCGRVKPYGARALTMSNVNPNGWSEYNFTMTFDTTLPPTGKLVIEFPEANYPDRLGLRPDALLYAPYPNQKTFDQVDRSLEIHLGEWPINQPLTVTISGIINSQKQGGTGNFKVYTKLNSHIVDINRNFAVIGLADETLQLLSASISINDYYAGEVTDYVATIQPSQDLISKVDFIITFPEIYVLTGLKTCSCNVFVANCTVHKDFLNQILITGNDASILKGTTVNITFNDITNPSRQMKTPLFNFRVIERDTNNTLQQSTAVNGLEIMAGKIKLISLVTQLYQPYAFFIRDFTLQFRPKNGFQYAKIATDFYQVLQCQITRGLLDPSQFEDSICNPIGKVMFLSNFQTYIESDYSYDYLEVRFKARIGSESILTNPVQIYTYKDADYLYLTDQDILSVDSQIQIVKLPAMTSSFAFTVTPGVQSTLSDISISAAIIPPALTAYLNPVFGFEIPQQFTGVPECLLEFPTVVVTCEFKFGFVNITTPIASYTPTGGSRLTVNGLKTPETAGSYPIGVFMQDPTKTYYNNITLVISPPKFFNDPSTTTTANQLSNHLNQQTAIYIQLELDCNVAAGIKNIEDPYVPFTTLEIYFYQFYITNTIFEYDLGSGLDNLAEYGCQFEDGFQAISGKKLSCVLFHGTNTASPTFTDYAMVKVQGFSAITATSETTKIMAFKIPTKYPSAVGAIPRIRIDLVYYNEKMRSILRSQSFNIGAVKNAIGNPLLVFSGPVLENPKLQVETTLTYKYKTILALTQYSSRYGIYYEIPTGFSFNQSQVLISIDGIYWDPSDIQYFPTFIFIKNMKLSNGITHTIIFERVNIPVSLPSASITHTIKTTTGGAFGDTATFTIPTLSKGTILDISTSISSDYQNHPYVNYSFAFTTSMKSYDGTKIVIDFPVGYDIQASNAYLDNIPYTNLKNSTNLISFDKPTTRKFRILNFQPLIKGQRVSIAIYSVKNPIQGTYTITISILDKNDQIIEDGTQQIIIGSSLFITQSLNIQSVNPLPNNKKALGLYSWIINVDFTIPKLSEIVLYLSGFSSVYSINPDVISCRIVQDSTIPLRQCLIQEMLTPPQIQITTDYIIKNKQFVIEYYGYLQLNAPLSGLQVIISYNGQTIASGNCPIVQVTDELIPSNVILDFYPKNEGEIAYYNFTLNVTTSYTLTTDKYILIRFPFEYDYIIGIEKIQVKSNTLQGALKMQIIPYHIKITGFYELKNFIGILDIILLGVINPNRLNNQATGTFLFGIMDGNQMILGNTAIDGIIPQLAPQLIQLNSVISSIKQSRYASTFNFQIHPFQKVLATVYGGQIYIDFPNNFIIDQFSGSCETTSEFSFFASCKWDYFRFIFVTNNLDWYADSQGDLSLTITNVLTPDDDGETNNFIIYNYDKINKIVLGRTYANLHKASLMYIYDGLQIDVNYKYPFLLEVGSYSDEIIVNITDKADFTLTLSPNVLDSQIIITPNPVQIIAGSSQATFRVAAPRTILLQTYYIQWSKTGDTLPVTYAPLRLTPLQMVKGTIKRKLIIEEMEYMPRNGTSYPLYITTNNPPYQELLIRIGFKLNITADVPLRQKMYITEDRLTQLGYTYSDLIESGQDISEHVFANLSTTQLQMSKLQYKAYYTLNISINYPNEPELLDNKTYLTLYYRLRGYDADSFELNTQLIKLWIRDQEYRKPKILETKILQITRSTVTFQVFADIYGFIYYVYADQHMPNPIYDETRYPNLKNQTLSYSNPNYGVDYVRTIVTFDVNFTITNLQPNHDYEIFLFVMNLNKVENPKFYKVYFQTMKSQSIALITLKINQGTVDSEVKMDYLQKMAEMIGITKSRLQERTTSCKQTILDTSTSSTFMYWNLMILPDPTNMNEYTKPLILGQTLNSRRIEIQKFITRLDDEPFYTLEEIQDNIPSFVINPEMIDRTTSSLSLRFTVSYCGKAYLTFRERNNSSNLSIVNETIFAQELQSIQFPSSYQIKNSLNESNQPINQTTITMTDTETYYQYNYTDLNSKTVYDVYISLENDIPTSPLLFNNNSVARFTAKTQKIIIPLNIYNFIDYFNIYYHMNIPNYFEGYLIGDLLQKTQIANIHQCSSIDQKNYYLIKIAPIQEQNAQILYYESQQLTKFKSPNIIQSISNNQNYSHVYSLFEDCDQNLQQYWEFKNKQLKNSEVIDICLQIVDALNILHENKIVHTDIRIENIFIKGKTYKLSNFERNYYLSTNQFSNLIKIPGDAPELINNQNITYKADIFSLGCLMFELLLGYKPFTQKQQQYDESCVNYLYAVDKEDLQINENIIEPKTYELITKMVKFRPEDRIDLQEIKNYLTQKEINVFKTTKGINLADPNCWGQDAFVDVTSTFSYTTEYFKNIFQKTKFFYDVSQSFGGKKFYNYQKTLFPRFMLLKKSYSILLYLKQLVMNQQTFSPDIVKEIDEFTGQLNQILLQLKDYILKEQNLDYKTINNWKSELNLDETSQFKDYYKQAIQFCIEYFEKSQLLYSKQKETPEQLKAFLIIYVNLKSCLIFNPFQITSTIQKDLEKKELNELIQISLIKL